MTHEQCTICKGWLKRDRHGILRHKPGEGARCDAILSGRVRAVRDTGLLPPDPPPPTHSPVGQYCLFCKSEIMEEGPGGLCLACEVRMKGEL